MHIYWYHSHSLIRFLSRVFFTNKEIRVENEILYESYFYVTLDSGKRRTQILRRAASQYRELKAFLASIGKTASHCAD